MRRNKRFKDQLYQRCVRFTIDVIRLTSSLKLGYEYYGILKQLINSASSIGANFAEGNGAVSRLEFIKFMNHSRKSALETLYWFDVIIKSNILRKQSSVKKAKILKKECDELTRIFSSIILTSKKK